MLILSQTRLGHIYDYIITTQAIRIKKFRKILSSNMQTTFSKQLQEQLSLINSALSGEGTWGNGCIDTYRLGGPQSQAGCCGEEQIPDPSGT
jgi:hypothetical protein